MYGGDPNHLRLSGMILQAGGHLLQKLLRPFINLWRCYALSHGMAFILETDPGWVGLLPELAGKGLINP